LFYLLDFDKFGFVEFFFVHFFSPTKRNEQKKRRIKRGEKDLPSLRKLPTSQSISYSKNSLIEFNKRLLG